MTTPVPGLPFAGPRGLTAATAGLTDGGVAVQMGVITAVTSRGLTVARAGGTIEDVAHLSSYNPAVGDPVALVRYQDAWLVTGRPVGPGTTLDTATPGSAAGTTLLDGMALAGAGVSIATSTGAVVVVPKYGVTFYHPPNHWVLLLIGVSWYSSVVNDWLTLSIRNSVTAARVFYTDKIQAGSNSFAQWETIGAMLPPSLGGKGASYYMDLQRVAGSGTSRVDDNLPERRGYMLALDMGDGAVIRTVA